MCLMLCSIRALFGESVVANAVHGSSSMEKAQVAIQTFVGEVPEEGEGEGEGGMCIFSAHNVFE